MSKTAFLFPGQGAQTVGMGASLIAGSPAAAEVFRRAADVLGFDLAAVCAKGPEADLSRTDVAQPAIYTVSVAALAALKEKGLPKTPPDFVAGLSLGEFTALHFAGSFGFEDGLRLVRRRGELMQQAADRTPGAMSGILGTDEPTIRALCAEATAGAQFVGEVLIPANFLCPGNTVISGHKAAVARGGELAEKKYGAKVFPLAVAGAFHSQLMTPAAEGLATALAQVKPVPPSLPVIANCTAESYGSQDPVSLLVRQLDNPVLWEQSMRRLLDSGVETFYEIGPGRVLAGLLKRINRRAKVVNVQTAEDAAAAAAA